MGLFNLKIILSGFLGLSTKPAPFIEILLNTSNICIHKGESMKYLLLLSFLLPISAFANPTTFCGDGDGRIIVDVSDTTIQFQIRGSEVEESTQTFTILKSIIVPEAELQSDAEEIGEEVAAAIAYSVRDPEGVEDAFGIVTGVSGTKYLVLAFPYAVLGSTAACQ